ncbi:hypothetical protein [Castellaniella sp.]|uniref:hypothetical protein n=1 Tax=Castellaniella sp. TaxID=1955812 RepID=UPI002AFEBF08|nr:hypothetical protein [Castellaniella sp.]
MSNTKISRFSSTRPEDIAWRVEQAHISGQIEGIERNPSLERFVQQMDDDGVSIEEQIARLVARAKRTVLIAGVVSETDEQEKQMRIA